MCWVWLYIGVLCLLLEVLQHSNESIDSHLKPWICVIYVAPGWNGDSWSKSGIRGVAWLSIHPRRGVGSGAKTPALCHNVSQYDSNSDSLILFLTKNGNKHKERYIIICNKYWKLHGTTHPPTAETKSPSGSSFFSPWAPFDKTCHAKILCIIIHLLTTCIYSQN